MADRRKRVRYERTESIGSPTGQLIAQALPGTSQQISQRTGRPVSTIQPMLSNLREAGHVCGEYRSELRQGPVGGTPYWWRLPG